MATNKLQYKGRPVCLRADADTRHERARDWYANYGAHVSTLAAGDVPVQAVEFDWLDEDDHEVVRRLMVEDGELLDFEADELVRLARGVREAAEDVCGSLDAAVEAYRRGDLASVIDWLDSASSTETDCGGDDPATSALASQLLAELPEFDDDERAEVLP